MKFNLLNPKQSLTLALRRQRPRRSELDVFKENLKGLLKNVSKDETEENQKTYIRDFLRNTYYEGLYEINTKDRKDLVIHLGKTRSDRVGVIMEVKRPGNKSEMPTKDKPNCKALQELVLYYMRERVKEINIDLKYLVITDVYEWYIIEAAWFEKTFYSNAKFLKEYEEWSEGKKVTPDTELFYKAIAKPFIDKLDEEVTGTWFDIRKYESELENQDDKTLIALYKLLSPSYLLKTRFEDDSNKLDERFYKELLHIIGLEEAKEGSKYIIRRKAENRHPGSLLENAISQLKTEGLDKVHDLNQHGSSGEEQRYNIALELCITWINRILFLKLLEGQLVNYHRGDKEYRFLNSDIIPDYGELFKLFHKVLAVDIYKRDEALKKKYSRVPYLNSSLFDISPLENETVKINSLDHSVKLEFISATILEEEMKQSKHDSLPSLDYLFKFLNAYDFASESTEDIDEENKTLINASVLGKVFEKINGYKDGSVFTPGFITMHMCRQAIRQAVVQKFKDEYKWDVNEFDDLINYIADHRKSDKILEFNELINSLHICDPAVGSGHFLVSALNEIIAIKSELGILADKTGIRLDCDVTILNDELNILTDWQGDLDFFEYKVHHGEVSDRMQRIQKTLFHEKQTIIENCLFGVDINPKSVLICRLRLWIELLKNAYYKEESNYKDVEKLPDIDRINTKKHKYTDLETLPNIDINIKCGNSLISRFPLDADLKRALKSIKYNIETYRGYVNEYKNAKDREYKKGLEKLIDDIKSNFRTQINDNHPTYKRLQAVGYELNVLVAPNIFREDDEPDYGNRNFKEEKKEKIRELEEEVNELTQEWNDIKNNVLYKNALEWRFEFPEVLNNNGEFEGFDVVIGNPPYGVSIRDKLREVIVESLGKVPDFEIYYFFINLSKKLLRKDGIKSFIIPNTILFNVFAKDYREKLFDSWEIKELLDCTDFNIFEGSANVRNVITLFVNNTVSKEVHYRPTNEVVSFEELINRELQPTDKETLLANNQNWALLFKLSPKVLSIVSKIKKNKKLLIEYFPETSQGLIAYDKYQGQDEDTIKNRIYHSFEKKVGFKPWLWGEDIKRYEVNWNKKEYINYSKGVANPREPKYFKGERILIREITNPRIYAGFSAIEQYNDPSIINIIKPSKEIITIKCLLGILNSKLATFYHFNSSPKATKGAFPKILVEDINNFPLPIVTKENQKSINQISGLTDKILSLKKAGKETSELEAEIDAMVYELYGLTEEEIKIVEGKG